MHIYWVGYRKPPRVILCICVCHCACVSPCMCTCLYVCKTYIKIYVFASVYVCFGFVLFFVGLEHLCTYNSLPLLTSSADSNPIRCARTPKAKLENKYHTNCVRCTSSNSFLLCQEKQISSLCFLPGYIFIIHFPCGGVGTVNKILRQRETSSRNNMHLSIDSIFFSKKKQCKNQ